MQDPFGDTAQGPALQSTRAMGGHGDQVRAAKAPCPFRVVATLGHADDACSDVLIAGDRPGDGQFEIGYRTGNQPLTNVSLGGAQVEFRLVHDGFSLALTELLGL